MSGTETQARVVAEAAPIAQCLLDSGTISYANPAMERLCGTDESVTGENLLDVLSVAEPDRLRSALSTVEDETTVRFTVGDGRDRRWIESRWRALDGDDRLVGTLFDITDRREDKHDSEILDSLLAELPLSIYVKDRQHRHERVSDHLVCQGDDVVTNAEGKRHPHPADVLGKTDWDIYGPAVAEDAVEEDRTVMETGEPIVDSIEESTTSLGEPIAVSTTKAPRYDDEGNVVGIVGVTVDVTDRVLDKRRLQRQHERMSEFTEMLTHDLRNPLQVASGYVDLLAERYEDPIVGKLSDALDRMDTLIDDSRTYILEGRSVGTTEPTDIAAVAADAWECVTTDQATLDVATDQSIQANPDRLQRLFENLFQNAVAHAGRDVTVTVSALADGFAVADDGPGIPEERRAKIFERGVTTAEDSTGFGLAIVESIATAHDWTVELTASETGGARFEFHDVVRVAEGD